MNTKWIKQAHPEPVVEIPMFIAGTIRMVGRSDADSSWWREARARIGYIFNNREKPLYTKELPVFPFCPPDNHLVVRYGYFWIPK